MNLWYLLNPHWLDKADLPGRDQAYSVIRYYPDPFHFNEAMTTLVLAQSPYASKGTRDTLNSTDNIYNNNGGSQMLLPVVQNGVVLPL